MAEALVDVVARALFEAPQSRYKFDDAIEQDKDMSRVQARVALAAIDAAGYAVVPKEPTEAMDLAVRSYNPCMSEFGQCYDEGTIYRAMIAAAPKVNLSP